MGGGVGGNQVFRGCRGGRRWGARYLGKRVFKTSRLLPLGLGERNACQWRWFGSTRSAANGGGCDLECRLELLLLFCNVCFQTTHSRVLSATPTMAHFALLAECPFRPEEIKPGDFDFEAHLPGNKKSRRGRRSRRRKERPKTTAPAATRGSSHTTPAATWGNHTFLRGSCCQRSARLWAIAPWGCNCRRPNSSRRGSRRSSVLCRWGKPSFP